MNNSNILKILSHNIVAARRAKAWSQEDLANRAGVATSTVSHTETATRSVSVIKADALAQALGLQLAELLDARFGPRLASSMPGATLFLEPEATLEIFDVKARARLVRADALNSSTGWRLDLFDQKSLWREAKRVKNELVWHIVEQGLVYGYEL